MNQTLPAISVIIPMYNAEKYIAECLESLLAQTFKDFEVIIVNDCSTDSSPAIVQSYAEKFDGRFKLVHMKKNSGGCAMPRNKALPFSRGEYIYSIDADDMITPTALEELYTLAKNYFADVVYCEKYYQSSADGKNIWLSYWQKGGFVDKPTFESEEFIDRVKCVLDETVWVTTWCKMVRRDLLTEYEIFFPDMGPSEDDIWNCGLLFYGKKFLRVPNVVYIWRQSEDSILRHKQTPQTKINFWLNPIVRGLKYLDRLMSKFDFFQQNPQYRYAMFELFLLKRMEFFLNSSFELSQFEVYETIIQRFSKDFGKHDVLFAVLCTALNTYQKTSLINRQKFEDFNRFAAQAQARIADLEKLCREKDAYISELENFITTSQKH